MLCLVIFILCSTLAFGEDLTEKCYHDGLCLGHLIEVQKSDPDHDEFNSIADCVNKCREVSGCKFTSFNSKQLTCTFSRACSQVVLKGSNYQHSNVDCRPKIVHKILIVGGNDAPEPNIEILINQAGYFDWCLDEHRRPWIVVGFFLGKFRLVKRGLKGGLGEWFLGERRLRLDQA